MISSFDQSVLRALCDELAETSRGLSNSEIDRLLDDCSIEDPTPKGGAWQMRPSKRERLLAALAACQTRDGCGNAVGAFVQAAMQPVRYIDTERLFAERREALNDALRFAGLALDSSGKLQQSARSATLSEGRRRARQLRATLEARSMHGEVLKACRPELLEENYFHAVLEAAKSIAQRLRDMTGLTVDGRELFAAALGGIRRGTPMVALNSLQTPSEQSEHVGLRELMSGVFGAFRNPTAHEPKKLWRMSEQDALDALSTISLIHRKLDYAVVLRQATDEEEQSG